MLKYVSVTTAALLCATLSCQAQTFNPLSSADVESSAPPNIVFILADDLGYGDLSCYGQAKYKTLQLDKMADEGVKLTQFYVTASACSPSRASILTGQYPLRAGVPRVLNPKSMTGLTLNAPLMPEALQKRGYATAAIGKWHLGHLPKFMPRKRGFDYFFGLPYSNDMKPTPLFRNEDIIEEPADQNSLTKRYTEEALQFIDRAVAGKKPFFLYFAHTFPHVPLHVSHEFKDSSGAGMYGDVVTEVDWSVGEVLRHLREKHLAENTLVIFTSDNGPWALQKENGGSAGKLRGAKGSDYEGGVREPFIAWWPGHLPAGKVVDVPAISTDMMPTLTRLAGATMPAGPKYDGQDIWAVLSEGKDPGERTFYFPDYYGGNVLRAVRKGDWKLLGAHPKAKLEDERTTELFNLKSDPYEQHNVAEQHPDIVADLSEKVSQKRVELETSYPWKDTKLNSPEALKYVTKP